jgi:hypothetical protein
LPSSPGGGTAGALLQGCRAGFGVRGWRGQARISLDNGCCRRRAVVLDQRSSGCGPGRWAFSDAFISSAWVSAYCDYSKPCGDRVPPNLVDKTANWRLRWCPTAAGGSWFWRIQGADGPRGLFVILLFATGIFARNLLSVSFLVICMRLCTVSLTSIQVWLDKKKV